MNRLSLLLLVTLAVVGCKAPRLGPYTSPKVTGRVLAADTGQPLAGVEVRRDARSRTWGIAGTPKGGELLIEKPGMRTGRNGRFSFPSERALTLFRPAGWDSVQLSFQRYGYERFQTNYSITTPGTNAPVEEPIVNAGDILLQPARKGNGE